MCDDSEDYGDDTSYSDSTETVTEIIEEVVEIYETEQEVENMALDFGNDNQPAAATPAFSTSKAQTVEVGQKINLSKAVGRAVTKYAIGMEWDEKDGMKADVDVSLILFKDGSPLPGNNNGGTPNCLVFYGRLEAAGIKAYGDNTTGDNAEFTTTTGCDEQVDIDLSAVEVDEIRVFASTHSEMYENGQPTGVEGDPIIFGRVANPVVTVFDNTASPAKPLYDVELDEEADMATSVEVAKFYLHKGDWKFTSMADEIGRTAFGLNGIISKYIK